MSRALLLSGAGAYADRWHDFPATSRRIAEVLADIGIDVSIEEDLAGGFAGLGMSTPDLLVVNAGHPEPAKPGTTPPAVRDGLRHYLAVGGPILAVHAAASTMPDCETWEQALGGRWVHGTSTHPDIGTSAVKVGSDAHPILSGLGDFEVYDERYSYLRTADDNVVLAVHEWEDHLHPLVWAREAFGGRVVYDALGHGVESYDSPERRLLLQNSAHWLLADDLSGRSG
jgi:type 1 glutamine amidotransferase